MFLILLCTVILVHSGFLKDIRDFNLPELVKLGEDVAQLQLNDVTEKDVTFYLFNKNVSNVLIGNATKHFVDHQIGTKFIVHGWIEDHGRSWYKEITEEYLKNGRYNIIQVDWARPARSAYVSSAWNTKFVGYFIANFIMDLKLPLNQVHIIGHSLGSHVAAFAGKKIIQVKKDKIYRITALDPAGPYFRELFVGENDRLNKKDALIVDVIHTDGGFYGDERQCGTLDIYINGGTRPQPGCLENVKVSSVGDFIEHGFCSHAKSHRYFIDSINKGKFHCRKCLTLLDYEEGLCNLRKEYVFHSEDVNESYLGKCFVTVNATKEPYLPKN